MVTLAAGRRPVNRQIHYPDFLSGHQQQQAVGEEAAQGGLRPDTLYNGQPPPPSRTTRRDGVLTQT